MVVVDGQGESTVAARRAFYAKQRVTVVFGHVQVVLAPGCGRRTGSTARAAMRVWRQGISSESE